VNVRLTCNHLQWRHCNILVIAELFWIELRYQRFKLLWQTAWLNKVNKRFFGRFVLIRIFRHASLLRLPLRESPREARRAPSRSRATACGAGCAFVLAEIQAKNNFDNNGLEATDYFVTKSQSLPSLTTTGVANLITNFFTVDQAFLASDNLAATFNCERPGCKSGIVLHGIFLHLAITDRPSFHTWMSYQRRPASSRDDQ
jgi:hypothetical protein